MSVLGNVIPSISWMRSYDRSWLRGDIIAGLTVGVILIPQGMAYAMLAGLPPIHGLYAATLPLLVYALFGTSRQLAVGPVAMDSLLTATAIAPLALGGSLEYAMLAALLALLVGVMQFLMGMFKLGFLVNFLSAPVVTGFTSAVAIIIALNQVPLLFGLDVAGREHVHLIFADIVGELAHMSLPTLVIGVASFTCILAVKFRWKRLPGALFALVLATLATWSFALEELGVAVVGNVPSGLPSLVAPSFSMETVGALASAAGVIALISFTEAIAIGKALQAKHRSQDVLPNKELRAIGLANMGASFVGAFPVTGGFSRTAVNDAAGANTPLASIISVAVVCLVLLFFTELFTLLPIATLAAIIFVSVLGLVRVKDLRNLWRFDKVDFVLAMTTLLAVLFLGIMPGIGLGVVLSLALVVYRTSYPHIATLGKLPNSDIYRNVRRFREAEQLPGVIVVRPDAPLFFGNVNALRERLYREEKKLGEPLRLVLIDGSAISSLDSTAVSWLQLVAEDCKRRNVTLMMSELIGPVRDVMEASGLFEVIGRDKIFMYTSSAIEAYIASLEGGVVAKPNPGAHQTGTHKPTT